MIKAFTLLEMVINMAIMGIIVGMVYMVYVLFSSHVGGYALFSTEFNNAKAFHNQLQEEVLTCDRIVPTPNDGFSMVFYDESEVVYHRKGAWLYREKNRMKDSLAIVGLNFKFLMQENSGDKLVESISITSSLQGRSVPFYVAKQYFSNYSIDTE
ncbi:MAG: type II secretion system GspH family protein [Flavobacteriaceae bacterium]|nr:type II secretion system GspH family protein [Flavobacteriaceae bacterium]